MSATAKTTTQQVNLQQLAKAVEQSEGFRLAVSAPGIAHVLDVALRSKVGIACLGGRELDIDLGNGYFLRCTLVPIESRDLTLTPVEPRASGRSAARDRSAA